MTFARAGQWGPEALIDGRGTPQPGAKLTLYEADGLTLATRWADAAKSAVAANPWTADVRGNALLFAEPGPHVLVVSVGHVLTSFVLAVPIDPLEPELESAADVAVHVAAHPAHAAAQVTVAIGAGVIAADVQAAITEITGFITSQEAGDSAAVAAVAAGLASEVSNARANEAELDDDIAETLAAAAADATTKANTRIPLTQKGAANGVATLDGNGKRPTSQGYRPDVIVDELVQGSDVDIRAAWIRAVAAVVGGGGKKRILFTDRSYVLSSGSLDVGGLNGVVVEGVGGEAMSFSATAAIGQVFAATSAVSDLVLRGLGFLGNVVDDVTGPRRSRTTVGSSFVNAIKISGDLVPHETNPAVMNLVVDWCRFKNISSLPTFLRGIRGEAAIEHAYVENCLDTGFIFCETGIFHRGTVRKSADNGISMSRGVGRAVITAFDIDGSAYNGIWCAGYETNDTVGAYPGPTNFEIGPGVITNSGLTGVQCFEAPKKGVIHGVTVNGVLRGPSDEPNDQAGVGIKLGGFPYNSDPANPTQYAEDILVADVVLEGCARGGIHLRSTKKARLDGALIVNPGSQFLADGVTAISGSDASQNFGVAVDSSYASTCSDIGVFNVTTVDDRATPLTNMGVYLTGSVRPAYSNNRTVGSFRNPQKYDNAVTVDSPSTATIPARLRLMRDNGALFDFQINNSSGDLDIVSRSTVGENFLLTLVTIARVTGIWTFASGSQLLLAAGLVAAGAFDETGVVSVAADYTFATNITTALVNASGAPRTITLPAAAVGRKRRVKKTDASVNAVIVVPAAGTIDGAANDTLGTQWQSHDYLSDGTNWFRI